MGLCLGYEDLNDHDELCRDRMMALLCESDDVNGERRHKESDREKALGGQEHVESAGVEAGAGQAQALPED